MQNFCIFAQCSGFWLIFIDFTKRRISASLLSAVDFGWFLLILPNAEFLHLCSVQWILADFYWFYQTQNFCILAQCSGFWLFFFLSYQMQNFCILAQCSGFWLIFIDFTKCRISASLHSAVDFGWFLLILPNAEFLHLCSVQWILADFYWFYQMQNFCIFAQCSGFWLIFVDFTKCRISASLLSAVDFGWFLLILPNAEFLHLCTVQWILADFCWFYQMQNFCIFAQCSGFWLIFIDFTKCRISASLLSAVDFGWFLLILPNAEFLHLCSVQ